MVAEGGRCGEGGVVRVDGVFFCPERVGRQCPEISGAEKPGFITVKERTTPPHVTAAGMATTSHDATQEGEGSEGGGRQKREGVALRRSPVGWCFSSPRAPAWVLVVKHGFARPETFTH